MHLVTMLYTALLRTQLEEYSVKFLVKQMRFDKISCVENKKDADSIKLQVHTMPYVLTSTKRMSE